MSFVHLHLHTEYSLLDGFAKIKNLMERTKEMGMPAVAITDHGTMFGVIEFYTKAKEMGIKPIIGLEAYLAPEDMQKKDPAKKNASHLLLLAENQTGYKNLLQIATASQLKGFYYHPRIDHEFLAAHAEGLICTSGCMAAEIPRSLQNGDFEKAKKQIEWYYDIFGRDRFFLELQDHDIPLLRTQNNHLLELGKEFGLNFVATNDTHYIEPGDWQYQDVLLAIQTGARLSDEKRMRMTGRTYYLRSPEEMRALFGNIPGAIENTLLIAERCNVNLDPNGYHLPVFTVPEGETSETQLRKLCEKGLIEKYKERKDTVEVRERFEKELSIIHSMGFDDYFLIVHDLVQHAIKENIWFNVRGSGAGSMVAYTLGITPVEPLDFKLIFERFLNPGRISMPDIDLDFQDDKRNLMMEYCSKKYGEDRVAQIITFSELGAKGAIRDVGRVMDLPLVVVDRISKLIPTGIKMPQSEDAITIENCLNAVPEFAAAVQADPQIQELVAVASQMEGIKRNAGTHAAGVIITDIPIGEYAPLHRPTSANEDSPIKSVAQFEMNIVDQMGLLKVDFLGLVTLTVMQKACEMIEKRHGVHLDLTNIPTDDSPTFQFLGKGHTAGVFQLESEGMTKNIVDMKPKNLDNIIAMVALYRPGPMQFIPSYIARMRGEEEPVYLHELMKPIFEDTFGIPVYQEQIMFAAMDLGGYSASEADGLRKAISKKKKGEVEKHRLIFIEGATKKGIPKEIAEKIFAEWERFANYGFNKSHAADYGVLAVQTGYLKTHYTIEYMTATLTANSSDSEKIAFYINDCRSFGIDVLPPKLNVSVWDFSVEDVPGEKSCIRFGLGAVKNVGQGPAEAIIAEREKGGPFTDLDDFVNRMDSRLVGRRALESLIKVGAMDEFGERGELLGGIELIMATSASIFKEKESPQLGLFDMSAVGAAKITLQKTPPLDPRDKLNWERELLGLFVSDHPLNGYLKTLRKRGCASFDGLEERADGSRITVGGLVQSLRVMITKKDAKAMCSAKLEDISGKQIEVMFYPKYWEICQDFVKIDNVILASGRLDKSRGALQVVAMEVELLDALNGGLAQDDADFVDNFSDEEFIEDLRIRVSDSHSSSPSPSGIYASDPSAGKTEKIEEDIPPWETMPADDSNLSFNPPAAPTGLSDIEPEIDDNWPTEEYDGLSFCAPMQREIAEQTQPMDIEPKEAPLVPELIASPAGTDVSQDAPDAHSPKEVEKFILPDSDYDDDPFLNRNESKPRLLTIILKPDSRSNAEINFRRTQRIYGLVKSYPGKDAFSFVIHENGRPNLVEFSDRVSICDELMEKLCAEVGNSNIRIEN